MRFEDQVDFDVLLRPGYDHPGRIDGLQNPKLEIVDDRVAEILRSKTPAERLAIADGLWRFALRMIREIVAREHPEWSQAEINRQVARRMSNGAF